MLLAALHAKEPIACALHLEVRAEAFTNADDAARAFGLRPIGDQWRCIDRDTATRVLMALLIEDMAYSCPRVPEEEATSACNEFLAHFGANSRFFTNGNWEDGRRTSGGGFHGPGWQPATAATFDGGVIVLDDARSGILWIEDED